MDFSCTVPDSYEGSHCKIQSTGTAVHIPYFQPSAGDLRVQLFYRIVLITVSPIQFVHSFLIFLR